MKFTTNFLGQWDNFFGKIKCQLANSSKLFKQTKHFINKNTPTKQQERMWCSSISMPIISNENTAEKTIEWVRFNALYE